ncbi:MAG: hypothetical protein ACYC67_11445 [Prosthecobacter sp.]|jgi:hypothetical protein
MEWRIYIYFGLLLLLLWLGPYVFIFFDHDTQKSPDTSASDRRLIRLCLRGLIAISAALFLFWWLG